MISIIRTSLVSLRRDRAALSLSFVLPVVFFTIFAIIFGGRRNSTPKVTVIVVDEDHSRASERLVKGLQSEQSLMVKTKQGAAQPEYTAATAEAAVKAGTAPVAIIVPHGFGANPMSLGAVSNGPAVGLLKDPSDMVAAQVATGLLQKVALTSMPDVMAELGSRYIDQYAGGFTAEQQKRIDAGLEELRRETGQRDTIAGVGRNTTGDAGLIAVQARDVVGENKDNPMVSFYAAAIGVMFLLFTASGSSGSLLDEVDSGTLDRVLSSHITMTRLLAGKLAFAMLLAFSQLVLMFLWAWAVFKLDFLPHIPGFVVMGVCTAFAVGAFGMLLASICRTRAQLGALSTLVILIMSSVGGSMFPRFLMPQAMQKAGLLTINAWAIDGFTKVFWRDEPLSHLWPQVLVLVAVGAVLFAIARRAAHRWEIV